MFQFLNTLREFTPKSWICFQEGYSRETIVQDIVAGISVGIITLPLAMAFAIAAGVPPERGIFTAIVAGFLISLLGGSRVQIGGPTGAFVVIVYSVVQRHGYDGLALATLLAGGMMILFAIARAGVLLKFIPYPVTTGLTSGIALTLFSSQIKDFFGLDIASVPVSFAAKWQMYFQYFASINFWSFAIGGSTLALLLFLKTRFPRIPGPIVAVFFATLAVYIFDIPIETIRTKFGSIPRTLPTPSLAFFSLEKIQAVFPDAITIALLAAIESLLSAVIADGATGHRHRSNAELFAQGVGNIGSVLFGGIPATGAIARTAANIRLGAKTPLAGMIHAVTILLLMGLFATVAAEIPLACLAGMLIYIAWNMSEIAHVRDILKGPKSDVLVLAITFILTVFIDLTVGVQVGVLLAAVLFLKKMTDATSVQVCRILIDQEEELSLEDSDLLLRKDIPEEISVFEIDGPLFYGVAYSLNEQLRRQAIQPRAFILRMHKVPLIDASGVHALKEFAATCKKKGVLFLVSGVKEERRKFFRQTGIESAIGAENIFNHFQASLEAAKYSFPQKFTPKALVTEM